MPKLPHISGTQAVKIFERLGFVVMRQNGATLCCAKVHRVASSQIIKKSRSERWREYCARLAYRQMNFCEHCMTSASNNPQTQYFTTDKVDKDQVTDYAQRNEWTLEEAEWWLAPVLSY